MVRQLEHLFLLPVVFAGKVLDWTIRPVISFTFSHYFVVFVGVAAWHMYVRPYWADLLGMLHIR